MANNLTQDEIDKLIADWENDLLSINNDIEMDDNRKCTCGVDSSIKNATPRMHYKWCEKIKK